MNYELVKLLDGSRWLMEPMAFRAMVKRAAAVTPEAIQAAVALHAQRQTGPRMFGDVAVIECCGPIVYKSSWFSMFFGGSSIEDMQAQLRQALADPAVKTIVFRWDSPGGSVEMVPEFADEVFAARGQKAIVSVADTMICSAALWIGAQAETIYTPVSGMIGSVGVVCEHEDISGLLEKAGVKITFITHGERKVDGNSYEPLSESAHAGIKAMVDEVGDEFDAAMARGRGVTKKVVAEKFGQGDCFRGKEAIALGLADKLSTFSQLLGKLTKGRAVTSLSGLATAEEERTIASLGEPPAVDIGAQATIEAKEDPDDPTVEPDADGECPDGYEIGEDEKCHLMPEPEAAAADAVNRAQADADLLSTTLAVMEQV